ncbi:hypothetical protein M1116_01390 [Patescibacteria group bacterium]|nr:hypothetical protein [Patescibacteria group bacterium]
MTTLTALSKEIAAIKLRNARVEADKKWETSWARRCLIALLTYAVMVLFMISIGVFQPFLNAIIPTLGFVLSTLTLDKVKRLWLKHVSK